MTRYFSDEEIGPVPRTVEDINGPTWGGLATIVNAGLEKGSFAESFPIKCDDPGREAIIGTDRVMFFTALKAEVPLAGEYLRNRLHLPGEDDVPTFLVALDILQFSYANATHARSKRRHDWEDHDHLGFDREEGRKRFRSAVNRIFERNGVALELVKNGRIRRTIPKEVEGLVTTPFDTGDQRLDKLLAIAIAKFRDPRPSQRKDATEKLWDAWERLKTLHALSREEKKKSIQSVLDETAADNEAFRELIETEADALTKIGNEFEIRHHERGQIPVEVSSHRDYLFYRLLAFIRLITASLGEEADSI